VIVFEAPHPVHSHHATQAPTGHRRITDHQYPPLMGDLALCHPPIPGLFHPRPSRSISMASHRRHWLAICHSRRTSFPNLHSRTCQPAPSLIDACLSGHAITTRPSCTLKVPPTLGIAPVTPTPRVFVRCYLVFCTQWLRFHVRITPHPQRHLTTPRISCDTNYDKRVARGHWGCLSNEHTFREAASRYLLKSSMMKSKFGFSIIVFAPLLLAFLLPALSLLPSGILVTLFSIFDPAISVSEGVGYIAWVCSPILAAVGLFLTGMWFHSLYLRGRSRKTVWIAIWIVFSVALFAAAWLGISLLTSIGASDYPADEFFQWTASVAALLTVACQPGVVLWLFVSSRILPAFE
jgi:hypothetical protein